MLLSQAYIFPRSMNDMILETASQELCTGMYSQSNNISIKWIVHLVLTVKKLDYGLSYGCPTITYLIQ